METMEIFATAEFVPTEDITSYELSRVLKFTLACTHRIGVAEPIKFDSISSYNEFVSKYNDILKHFNIKVYGNVDTRYVGHGYPYKVKNDNE
jgi:hypothetical protein